MLSRVSEHQPALVRLASLGPWPGRELRLEVISASDSIGSSLVVCGPERHSTTVHGKLLML